MQYSHRITHSNNIVIFVINIRDGFFQDQPCDDAAIFDSAARVTTSFGVAHSIACNLLQPTSLHSQDWEKTTAAHNLQISQRGMASLMQSATLVWAVSQFVPLADSTQQYC